VFGNAAVSYVTQEGDTGINYERFSDALAKAYFARVENRWVEEPFMAKAKKTSSRARKAAPKRSAARAATASQIPSGAIDVTDDTAEQLVSKITPLQQQDQRALVSRRRETVLAVGGKKRCQRDATRGCGLSFESSGSGERRAVTCQTFTPKSPHNSLSRTQGSRGMSIHSSG
jgi:hypothetical protein